MATLPTLLVNANSGSGPRNWSLQDFATINEGIANANGATIQEGGENANATKDTSFLLADMPANFGAITVLGVSWRIRVAGAQTNTRQFLMRIVKESDGTVLAAANSGGAFRVLNTTVSNTAFQNFNISNWVTGGNYLNTAATKADWDDARIELRSVTTRNMGGDTNGILVDTIEFVGTYFEAPSAPQNLVATPGNEQVTLSWDAPSSSGDSAITGYQWRRFDAEPQIESWGTTVFGSSANAGSIHFKFESSFSHIYAVRFRLNNDATPITVSLAQTRGGTPLASKQAVGSPVLGTTPILVVFDTPVPVPPSGVLWLTIVSGNYSLPFAAASQYPVGELWLGDFQITNVLIGASLGGEATDFGATSTSSSHTAIGLINDKEYLFAVRASNSYGPGPAAGTEGTPTGGAIPLTAPGNLALTFINTETEYGFKVDWDPVSQADFYVVHVKEPVSEEEIFIDTPDATISFEMVPHEEYEVRVRAVKGIEEPWDEEGPWSTIETIDLRVPAPILSVSNVGQDFIELEWSELLRAFAYEIVRNETVSFYTSNPTYLDENLEENTEYEYKVRGGTAFGEGPWSNIVTQTTGLQASPLPLKIGSSQVDAAYIGELPLDAIYKGSTQLWP